MSAGGGDGTAARLTPPPGIPQPMPGGRAQERDKILFGDEPVAGTVDRVEQVEQLGVADDLLRQLGVAADGAAEVIDLEATRVVAVVLLEQPSRSSVVA